MSVEAAISFTIAIFIFGITPGPGIFAILARSITEGAKPCFMLALGMSVSDAIYLVLACFGLATLAEHWSGAFTVIRILGALYLFYLGYKLFTTPIDTNTDAAKLNSRGELMSFMQGLAISASNPKVILFYIAFLPTFMDLTALTTQDIVLAVILTIFALMAGLMMIAVGADRASKLLKTPTAIRRLNQSAGSLMIAAGAFLASRS